ncbi:type I restriction endonuclease subunit M [Helicobacter pylori]|nr:type I restriction endonuclease subunit M [Helicobacter pylori]
MSFKNGIIAYLPHKYRANARDKKIIFFAIMKPLKAKNAKQNRQSKNTKRGLLSWKTKTLKRINLLH